MAAEQKVKVSIEADASQAAREIKKTETAFQKFSGFLKSKFVITLGDVTRVAAAAVDAFGLFIEAAKRQEDAVKSLDTALQQTTTQSEVYSKALQEQAAALELTTKFGDEAIISAQSLLVTMGVSADQMESATQATVDLAAALGISLESAARNVAKTTGGFAGELGEVIPELKSLSKEALQAGKGIELLGKLFAGAAAANADTFSGAVSQLENALGTLAEVAGDAVIKNDEIVKSLQEFRDLLADPTTIANVTEFAKTVVEITLFLGKMTIAVQDLDFPLRDLLLGTIGGVFDAVEAFEDWWKVTEAVGDSTNRFAKTQAKLEIATKGNVQQTKAWRIEQDRMTKVTDEGTAALEAFRKEMDRDFLAAKNASDATEAFKEKMRSLGVTLQTDVNKELEDNAKFLEEANQRFRDGLIDRDEFEAAERAVAAANAEVTGSLMDQARGFDEVTEATARTTEEFRVLRDASGETTEQLLRQSGAEATLSAQQGARFAQNLAGGESTFSTLSGGTFSVANPRRVNVLGGGVIQRGQTITRGANLV